jgi:hypothetical protein
MLNHALELRTDVTRTVNERTGVRFLLHTQSGRCYTLNRTATYVWQRLSSGASPLTIVDDLWQHSKRPPEAVAADVESFVRQLVSSGLARVA